MTESLDSFTVGRAAELSGLTGVMLDYLCRQKVLVPSAPGRRGRGRPRQYSFGDVVMLRVLANLLRAGVSVRRLKLALTAFRSQQQLIRSDSPLPTPYLVTDGRQIYLKDRAGLLDLDGTGQRSFVFVVEIETLRQEVVEVSSRRSANGRS